MADAVVLTHSSDFDETELRLGIGLPDKANANYGKRGFHQTVDLKLNLDVDAGNHDLNSQGLNAADKTPTPNDSVKPPAAKAQVVGWPPVRSFRKNAMAVQPKAETAEGASAAFVKVSMDGAPYLRKVDLKMYKTYKELSDALGKMFSSFTIGRCDSQGMMDFMNESKVKGSEYVPTYEDKDGDWMLVGDVPWEMFVESCKRLRIMKGTEAKGLAPRALEKCKTKN